jgi:hypothetical protein
MNKAGAPLVSGLLWLFAISYLANAVAMLFFAHAWFFRIVPGVPDTGPYNFHLVADSGTFNAGIAAGLIAAAINPYRNAVAVMVAAVASTVHGILHICSHLAGWLSPAHLTSEVFLIYIPTAVLCWMAAAAWRLSTPVASKQRRAA